MAEKRVRINEGTHQRLQSLATQTGESAQKIIDRAVEHYRRKLFLEGLSNDFYNLREDVVTMEEERKESALWNRTLQDGLEN